VNFGSFATDKSTPDIRGSDINSTAFVNPLACCSISKSSNQFSTSCKGLARRSGKRKIRIPSLLNALATHIGSGQNQYPEREQDGHACIFGHPRLPLVQSQRGRVPFELFRSRFRESREFKRMSVIHSRVREWIGLMDDGGIFSESGEVEMEWPVVLGQPTRAVKLRSEKNLDELIQ
jgi:hypothetical protein